jgi:hypothetical protein
VTARSGFYPAGPFPFLVVVTLRSSNEAAHSGAVVIAIAPSAAAIHNCR